MNLRYVVPAFGLMALTATAASAQEIAKGVTLDGYLDTIATATSNTAPKEYGTPGNPAAGTPSTTDFYTEACLKVGWSITDRVKTVISTRAVDTGTFGVAEGYASVQVTPELTVSAGKSAGPFGYYSFYPTGLTTTNYALTLNMYTVNPVGVWAAYAATDKLTITGILADGFNSGSASSGYPFGAYKVNGDVGKSNKPGTVSPGLDIVFNPTAEVSLNLEGYVDPSTSTLDSGSTFFVGFNGQYKQDKILAGGEVLYRVMQKSYTEFSSGDIKDQKDLSWAVYLTYTLPTTMPMAATLQVSQFLPGDTSDANSATDIEKDAVTKIQLALLTNPFTESTFGLNYELFYIDDNKKNNALEFASTDPTKEKAVGTFGFSIEGLFVIP